MGEVEFAYNSYLKQNEVVQLLRWNQKLDVASTDCAIDGTSERNLSEARDVGLAS